MFCAKCGKEFSDGSANCPFCLEPVKEKKKFVVNFPDEEAHKESDSIFSFDRQQEYAKSFSEHENDIYSGKAESTEPDEPEQEQKIFFPGEAVRNDTPPVAKDDPKITENESGADLNLPRRPTEKTAGASKQSISKKKINKPSPEKTNPKSAKAFLTVKIMIAVCVLLTVGLTAVGAATPIFKNSAGVGKTVALTGLSKEAEADFENIAPSLSVFFEDGYDSRKVTFDNIVSYLAPDSEYGLYTALFSKKESYENQIDPLERFSKDDVTSYISVDSEEIAETAGLLGLTAYDDINTSYCYCCNDRYYFAPSDQYFAKSDEPEKMQVKVTSSKLTNEGEYYIECALYPEDAERDEKGNFSAEPESNVYFLAACEKNGESFDWAVSRISSTPLFDQTGAAVSGEETDALPYEMKTKTIKAVTSSGLTYAEYTIEYPFFSGDGITQTTVNTLYHELISSYQTKADSADKLYKEYGKTGADESRLPIKVHIVSTVTFNEKGYLSLLERTTENDPTESDGDAQTTETTTQSYWYTTQTETEPQSEKAEIPETTYEGYTFDIESGDFVQKDDVLGKDYQAVQKLLFETYRGEETEEPAEQPTDTYSYGYGQPESEGETEDTEGIGQKIYSCAWVLTPEGVGFCYQPENGGLETVILGYDKLEDNHLF